MAFSYGFYNSRAGDRKYDATQMSSIFDGIIRDGIFMYVGDKFAVTAIGGFAITVGSGRAWFNHTWSYNDSKMALTVAPSDPLLDRIDALVLEIDARDESRMNTIKWVYGEPATIPERPELTKEGYFNQYPLAYVRINRGVGEIRQADITNMIGTTELPYVTAPLEILDATQLIAQWNDQWAAFVDDMERQKAEYKEAWQTDFVDVYDQLLDEMRAIYQSIETQVFMLFNHNFDDWSVKRGTKKDTTFLLGGNINEKIILIASSSLLAERNTMFDADGSITESVRFYPWVNTEGSVTTQTISFTITRRTTFNADGSVTETIF